MTTATAERRLTLDAPPPRTSPAPDAAPNPAAPAAFDAPDSDTAPTGGLGLHHLASILRGTPEYQELLTALTDITPSARAQTMPDSVPYLLATLLQDLRLPALIVAPRPEDARRLHERLTAWMPDAARVHQFPETETLPFERLYTDIDTVQQRLRVLDALLDRSNQLGAPPAVIASATSVAQRTLDPRVFRSATHTVSVGDVLDLQDALESWQRMGYRFENAVYGPGFVSRRGGIIDIFPVGAELPARIELWGDEVDSIRLFDPSSQRSIELVQSIRVAPAHETLPAMTDSDELDLRMSRIDVSNCTDDHRERVREEFSLLLDGIEVDDLNMYAGFFNHGSLLDYLPNDCLVVQIQPDAIAAAAWDNEERIHDLRESKEQRGELPLHFPSFHTDWNALGPALADKGARLEILHWGADGLKMGKMMTMPFSGAPVFMGRVNSFADDAANLTANGARVVAATSHSRRLDEILSEDGVPHALAASLTAEPPPGSLTLVQSSGPNFGDGFVLNAPDGRLTLLGDTEIFGVTKQRRVVRRNRANWDAFLSEISPGDFVVHVEHGVGRFLSVGKPADGGDAGTEYLVLEYANRDRLYVPLEHLDRVTPYVAPSDAPPHLTRLGTQEWSRAKLRAERSTREMAAELIALYAARELVEGVNFSPDSTWQRELEESFPFEETPDQLATLAEVKADMESAKPMDRLVCGDVGYGKTEIALRAAFKAVMEGKQVGVLVPTTVLAQQHFTTFSERLSPYPVTVEALSRFRTRAEQRDIVKRLAEGKIDICIGTHRLIQKDVKFKDLGLVVVDEEQRFGVGHKERLKQMRQEVDVLTLTATPIPRTLHMSLAGVRDMSSIQTPPEERMAIKTYVSEFSDELIREAVLRELDRQGQVYFLHNRVYNIEYMANYIGDIVPEARVSIAHGQMAEGELERAMASFAAGESDVLVCTTIIESGLDIPNVNTLIVNRADSFGLAQLYQIRGRVGRSSRRAYAYLMTPPYRSLNDTAERRLNAMLAATELGAGFRIAMKDLEIRGAGNILGAEQSGNIHAVGFELYTRMLEHAVEDIRARRESGELAGMTPQQIAAAVNDDAQDTITDALTPDPGVGLNLDIPASLPAGYVHDLRARMGLYQRIIAFEETSQLDAMEDELRDRFGPMPWQAQALLYSARLRIIGKDAAIESIVREPDRIVLRMKHEVGGARNALRRRLPRAAEVGNNQIRLHLDNVKKAWEDELLELVTELAAFNRDMTRQMLSAAAS